MAPPQLSIFEDLDSFGPPTRQATKDEIIGVLTCLQRLMVDADTIGLSAVKRCIIAMVAWLFPGAADELREENTASPISDSDAKIFGEFGKAIAVEQRRENLDGEKVSDQYNAAFGLTRALIKPTRATHNTIRDIDMLLTISPKTIFAWFAMNHYLGVKDPSALVDPEKGLTARARVLVSTHKLRCDPKEDWLLMFNGFVEFRVASAKKIFVAWSEMPGLLTGVSGLILESFLEPKFVYHTILGTLVPFMQWNNMGYYCMIRDALEKYPELRKVTALRPNIAVFDAGRREIDAYAKDKAPYARLVMPRAFPSMSRSNMQILAEVGRLVLIESSETGRSAYSNPSYAVLGATALNAAKMIAKKAESKEQASEEIEEGQEPESSKKAEKKRIIVNE